MTILKIPKQFILIGSPVTHSLSPILHRLFASQFNIAINYEAQNATSDTYLDIITKFSEHGGCGANITAPLKSLMFQNLKYVDAAAQLARAVNTLCIKNDGTLHGYNTDGIGLLYDLKHKAITINNSTLLILGAGGAVRGILGPLLSELPKSVIIVNRDLAKAKKIADDFKSIGTVRVKKLQDLPTIKAALIINATSGTPEYLHSLNFNNSCCYDLNYILEVTEFMKNAVNNGALRAYNGLGMLVEQAAAAFALWHNVYPDTQKALEQLQQNTVKKSVANEL